MSSDIDESFVEAIAAALDETMLEAIIVGNTAAILQGAPVLTQDVDLLIRDTERNRQKLAAFARAIGGTRPALISDLSRTLRIYGASTPIDVLFNQLSGGLRFESLRTRASKRIVGSRTVTLASLEDIIKSKMAAGRDKDRAVLPILQGTLKAKLALEAERPKGPGRKR